MSSMNTKPPVPFPNFAPSLQHPDMAPPIGRRWGSLTPLDPGEDKAIYFNKGRFDLYVLQIGAVIEWDGKHTRDSRITIRRSIEALHIQVENRALRNEEKYRLMPGDRVKIGEKLYRFNLLTDDKTYRSGFWRFYSRNHASYGEWTEEPRDVTVLKFPSPYFGGLSTNWAHAACEVTRSKDLNHPNIVEVREIFKSTTENDYHDYAICNEEYRALSLDAIGNITLSTLQSYARQICEALAYMHGKGLVHLDVTFETIYLDKNGNIKLLDIGFTRDLIARAKNAPCTIELEPFHRKSPISWAPELATLGPIDETADSYALGTLLYLLHCGEDVNTIPNKNGLTWVQQLRARKSAYDRVKDWQFSDTFADFLRKLLVKDRTKRITAAQALEHPWMREEIKESENDMSHDEEEASVVSEESGDDGEGNSSVADEEENADDITVDSENENETSVDGEGTGDELDADDEHSTATESSENEDEELETETDTEYEYDIDMVTDEEDEDDSEFDDETAHDSDVETIYPADDETPHQSDNESVHVGEDATSANARPSKRKPSAQNSSTDVLNESPTKRAKLSEGAVVAKTVERMASLHLDDKLAAFKNAAKKFNPSSGRANTLRVKPVRRLSTWAALKLDE
ncbi:kinase-like protein [Punctularia strigosozonata HHB-11173 SS5]|uniref:kinase-like protein n=1 Tax=Punctularia strigosozonata (strain HHB-11173) TaxID=741275 RepID=UPI0004417310|nr:kinase-like protein [Punctularia strigosozonata HHB-11173 SS5]EIN08416.1 kinase-like protein [Punctularia strigosozonata HHB-11173 SS5]